LVCSCSCSGEVGLVVTLIGFQGGSGFQFEHIITIVSVSQLVLFVLCMGGCSHGSGYAFISSSLRFINACVSWQSLFFYFRLICCALG
jgi:hypothetical protein